MSRFLLTDKLESMMFFGEMLDVKGPLLSKSPLSDQPEMQAPAHFVKGKVSIELRLCDPNAVGSARKNVAFNQVSVLCWKRLRM